MARRGAMEGQLLATVPTVTALVTLTAVDGKLKAKSKAGAREFIHEFADESID